MANATSTVVSYTTKEQVLGAVASGKLGIDDAAKILAGMEKPRQALHAKVSEKGAVSVYGLQRMPVTLYVGQWDRLLDYADALKAFIEANRSKLSVKP